MNRHKYQTVNMNNGKSTSRITNILIILCTFLLFGSLVPSLHAEILYQNDFNDDPNGLYTASNLKEDWQTSTNGFLTVEYHDGVDENRVNIVDVPEAYVGNSLRITALEGERGASAGAAVWDLLLQNDYNELYVSYWVKFNENIDWVKGGKLPGLCAGNCPFSKPTGTEGFNVRISWRIDGEIIFYVYHQEQPGTYGDNIYWDLLGSKTYFSPGTWHHVEMRVKINTPNQNDGILQGWFDGVLSVDRKNIRWRDVDTVKINQILFQYFWGGGDLSYAPVKNEYAYFDNYTISTHRVGPGGSTPQVPQNVPIPPKNLTIKP